jgi:hypothetical protein
MHTAKPNAQLTMRVFSVSGNKLPYLASRGFHSTIFVPTSNAEGHSSLANRRRQPGFLRGRDARVMPADTSGLLHPILGSRLLRARRAGKSKAPHQASEIDGTGHSTTYTP